MASVGTSRNGHVNDRGPVVARVRSVGGLLLIVVGLLGLVVPIIPGIPLMMAGVAILGRKHPLVRPALGWLRRQREAWQKARRKAK